MNSYQINIVLEAGSDVTGYLDVYNAKCDKKDKSIEEVFSILFGSDLPKDLMDLHVDSFRLFTNEIEITAYGSKYPSKELPDTLVLITIPGSYAIKCSTIYDDGATKQYHCIDGKKCSYSKYNSFYKQYKIKDPTDEFIRKLNAYDFKGASSIFNSVDLSKIDPYAYDPTRPWQLVLLQETKHIDLAKTLLKNGVITEVCPTNKISWLTNIIPRSPLAILEFFLNMGYTTMSHDKDLTLIHCALDSDTPDSLDKLKCLLETEPSSMSKVTSYGSPLWHRGSNIACCEYLESCGGENIAPKGFYNSLKSLDKVVESAKHNDATSFELFYEPAYRNVALFHAIENQSFDVIKSLDNKSSINWLETIDKDFLIESEEHLDYEGMCLCELALKPVDYGRFFWQSSKLLDLIKGNLSRNIKTMKSENREYSEDTVSKAKQQIERYNIWKKRNLKAHNK